MFTPQSRMNTLIAIASSVVFGFAVPSDAAAQGRVLSRFRANNALQHQYNQQNARGIHHAARAAWHNGHSFIAGQGYSNAFQAAYDQAHSSNPHVRNRGIYALQGIARQQALSNGVTAGGYIRQAAANALYNLQVQQARRQAHAARVQQQVGHGLRASNAGQALLWMARNFDAKQIKINPHYTPRSNITSHGGHSGRQIPPQR